MAALSMAALSALQEAVDLVLAFDTLQGSSRGTATFSAQQACLCCNLLMPVHGFALCTAGGG